MKNKKILSKLTDFRNFLYITWKHLKLPEPTPIQYDLANYLATGSSRTIISAYRGAGKSWITSAYVLWRLLLDPQINILVVSASNGATGKIVGIFKDTNSVKIDFNHSLAGKTLIFDLTLREILE